MVEGALKDGARVPMRGIRWLLFIWAWEIADTPSRIPQIMLMCFMENELT
jgi:hypothetical protein